jgi:transcriptional regulator with XRE-family HTH domain
MPNRRTNLDEQIAEFLRAFGERLEEVRRQRKMKQAELAAKAGCTPGTISRFERGLNFPDIMTLLRIRAALRVSLDVLVLGRPVEVRNPQLLEWFRALDALAPEQLAKFLPILEACLASLPQETGRPLPARQPVPSQGRRTPWPT